MAKDYNNVLNSLKGKTENINNNVEKIESYTKKISDTLKNNNTSKKSIISVNALTLLTVIISFMSLIVACFAMYSSNKLAINNSSLIFTIENIYIRTLSGKDGLLVNVGENGIAQGGAKIYIDIKVESGQIASLYLVQEQDCKFIFSLLNEKGIQDKSSGIRSYCVDTYFDMEEKESIDDSLFGTSQLYILSEDINGKISIDVIQVNGPIIKKRTDDNNIVVNLIETEYSFRYLKNNKLITLYNKDSIDEEWVNLTDLYPNVPKETNIEKIENDFAIIKEMYAAFRY